MATAKKAVKSATTVKKPRKPRTKKVSVEEVIVNQELQKVIEVPKPKVPIEVEPEYTSDLYSTPDVEQKNSASLNSTKNYVIGLAVIIIILFIISHLIK